MLAEAEQYGSDEILIDDYLAFITHFAGAGTPEPEPELPAGQGQQRAESLLEVEQARRGLAERRLDQNTTALQQLRRSERELSDRLTQAVSDAAAEVEAARRQGQEMERGWMEERHAMKAELQAARQEWAAGSAEMGRSLAVSPAQNP